ncbi:acyl-CoA dehydrogenase family protein [Streptomyces sp. NPDC057557]|uniref:acyl-CoA dehydrogenase family protein n=1 Tax=Streptomyces sp. NPDC057557 TaxID=3346167 RepID=UPI0036CBAEBF
MPCQAFRAREDRQDRTYAKQRHQFGMPLAAFQLIQYRLARMLADITDMVCMNYRLSQLLDEGKFSLPRVALAKMHYTERARAILSDARDMLGGNGILLDSNKTFSPASSRPPAPTPCCSPPPRASAPPTSPRR